MDYVLNAVDGKKRVLRVDNIKDFLRGTLRTILPEFDIPESAVLKVSDLNEDLVRFSVVLPPSQLVDDESAAIAYDLYDNLAYVFGKGYDDLKPDGRHEMVWYLDKHPSGEDAIQTVTRQLIAFS